MGALQCRKIPPRYESAKGKTRRLGPSPAPARTPALIGLQRFAHPVGSRPPPIETPRGLDIGSSGTLVSGAVVGPYGLGS
jgi:hypothetical protein